MRTSYKNRIYKNFNEFLSDAPNNGDRAIMKKELNSAIQTLLKNNIDSPCEFVNIMMRFNLSRSVITEYLTQLVSANKEEMQLSKRVLNHSNAFEKNTIMTFYSLNQPKEMLRMFKQFVSDKFPHFSNKDDLFTLVEGEINRVSEKTSGTEIELNNPSDQNSQFDISDVIVDGFFNDIDCDFFSSIENNNDDEFIAVFDDYLYN